MPINYLIHGQSPIRSNEIKAVANAIEKTLAIEGQYDLGLSFVDREEIKDLNSKYANNDYPTDVLSFEYGDKDGDFGDIAICTEIAQQQAIDNEISETEELSLLLIHGTLHLLGYDHQTEAETASLDKLQGDIMKLLNYNYRNFKWAH